MADEAEVPDKPLRGRPRKMTPAQFKERADAYFQARETAGKPYTVTGLARATGCINRQQLEDYRGDPRFSRLVEEARQRVEEGYEERLFAPAPTGAIFALKAMHNWRDGSETGGLLGGISALLQALDARDVTPRAPLIEVKATREDDDE